MVCGMHQRLDSVLKMEEVELCGSTANGGTGRCLEALRNVPGLELCVDGRSWNCGITTKSPQVEVGGIFDGSIH